MTFDLSGYIDVAERITRFREQYPEGSLQSTVLRWPDKDIAFVAVEARAYRYSDDPRPGYGLAWEPFPGTTPYTRDSELQNAETSAWGRALVAVLAADTKKGIASRNEIESRRTSDSGTSRRGEGPGSSPSLPESVSPEAERHGARGESATAPGVAAHETPPASGTTSAPPVIGSGGTAESGSGVAAGEAAAAPDPGQLPHEAVWIQSPKVKSMVVCEVPRCVLHPARRKDETTVPA